MSDYSKLITFAKELLKKDESYGYTHIAKLYLRINPNYTYTPEQLRKVLSREFNKIAKPSKEANTNFYQVVGKDPQAESITSYATFTEGYSKPTIVKVKSTRGKIVGIIGDTHEPFTHKDYKNFCYDVFNKYKVDTIVHIGDEVDNHAISYHEHDPNGRSAGDEMELAQKAMDQWYKMFPNVSVIIGNHTALPFRQANSLGIPKKFIKSYEEAWQAPKGWSWNNEIEIDHVRYVHGIGCSGQNGAINLAIRSRQSTVIGHIHSFGGVNYHANTNDLIFGMNVGCGIDVHAYAFEYGRPFVNKPTLGCGIVTEGQEANFIPMKLGKKYEWIR